MPIFSGNKPDKVMSRQAQDPARDKNLAKLFHRICELEKTLLLNISVGAQHMLYFRHSKTKELSQVRIQCRFLRDRYDGPARVSFFVEGPTEILCKKVCVRSEAEPLNALGSSGGDGKKKKSQKKKKRLT
jgi:hypothetical protein